jgi:hypothetical protein
MKSFRTHLRSVLIAAAMLGSHGLAAAPDAQGVLATGSGRAGAVVAGVAALIGVVIGALARSRSANPDDSRETRDMAIVAIVMAIVGMALAALHLLTSTGGLGTGNGRGGAIVALILGGVAFLLGRRSLARSG